jgi:uncharacterized protein YdaU (DUF1376 family)
MSQSPYVHFYTSDFLGGTGGMTASTKGVYITLLCLMYETEAPLTQSWATLARRCGCTLAAFKRAVQELEDDQKITVKGGALWSEKCEKHIALRHERRDSAKAAAEKRWQKNEQKQRSGDATASSAQCLPDPEPEIEKREAKASPKKGSRLSSDWKLPREWGEWALSQGWPEPMIREEAEKFRDYWIARTGKDATKLDWQATWRNWMRNSKARKPDHGGRNARQPIADRLEARFAQMDCWADRDDAEPLLPPGGRRPDRGSCDDGLDQGVVWLHAGTDRRCM